MNNKDQKKKDSNIPEKPVVNGKKTRKDPFIGRRVGNCEIREKINEGGTANIYVAYNVNFHLDRVVKILKPSLVDEEDFFDRFVQEAQLTARLDHPNILRVFDTGPVDDYFYIEMEYLRGQNLRAYIQSSSRINERDILNIGLQIVRALKYAHSVNLKAPDGSAVSGILHRDIKPENIMITPGNTVKLMDFGAAKPLNITSDTMQGMIVGTFHYMSPEQLAGKELDVRSDFFSLGIVLYEMITGHKPFSASNLTKLIEKISKCKYIKLRKLRPSISHITEELVDTLLSRKPAHRPRSAKEVEERITTCIQSYSKWGVGTKIVAPFSLKRMFPSISMIFSTVALVLSLHVYLNGPSGSMRNAGSQKIESASLLKRARQIEREGDWSAAVEVYGKVPSVKDGGKANEYLEAKVREAFICFTHLNRLTKATSILERLREDYSDPVIDAYLGFVYFKRALYNEARERIDAAIKSDKGSIIPQTDEYRRKLFYFYANSIDRQYIYINRDEKILREALMAWEYFIDYAACKENTDNRFCEFALERKEELEKIKMERMKKESEGQR